MKYNFRKILIILIILALFILIFLSFHLLKKYSDKKNHFTIDLSETIDITFRDRKYALPKGWFRRNYEESNTEKLNIYNQELNAQAIVSVISREVLNYRIGQLKDLSSLQTTLKQNDINVHDGVFKTYVNKKIAVFKLDDMLLAYLDAYDNNLYAVRIIAGKYTDDGEEKIYDYDTLEKIVAILETGRKA